MEYYFVPDDRPFIEYPHVFHPTDFLPDPGPPDGIGFVPFDTKFRKGDDEPPNQSLKPCGKEEWWRNGVPTPPDPPIAVDGFGRIQCCGGSGPPPCGNLPKGGRDVYAFDIVLSPGDCSDSATFSGLWKLNKTMTPCLWKSLSIPAICDFGTDAHYALEFIDPTTMAIELVFTPTGGSPDSGSVFEYHADVSSWNGSDPLTFALAGVPMTSYSLPTSFVMYPG